MVKAEAGNATLLVLGVTFGVMCCFLLMCVLIKAQLAHVAAANAANAAALAATKALGEVFVSDIAPVAQEKLDIVMRQVLADPLYATAEQQIIKQYTVPSQLQNDLLAGKRGRGIPLKTLLAYRPFFSEQELGRQLHASFQRHAEQEIAAAVKQYLLENGAAGTGTVRFPVHGRIEVEAKQQLHVSGFAKWLQQKDSYVAGKGHALFINVLDTSDIPYDVSGLTVLQAVLD